MSTPDLSPAGSSTYTSNTLHVGDGTWDNGRDDFLLPNLMGVNFATMRYNGMGNRFRNQPGYYRLIVGHGVLAAIVFLAILPAAALIAKFYTRNPRMAVRLHVYLQILTVFLTTVVVVLGWFAVGPERSLTNPHHGIGIAIYVCVLVQFLYGWLMARLERKRKDPGALTRTPRKVWVHKLFGRSIGLLGFVQVALGLTLYGSPKVLFILYALVGFLLLLVYLALDRRYFEKRQVGFGFEGGPEFYSDYGSYLSGSRADYRSGAGGPGPGPPLPRERDRSHWGRNILAGVGAAGAYEAFQRRRSQRSEQREERMQSAETEAERRERIEQAEIDAERRHRPPPPGGMMAPSALPPSRRSSRPPPGVEYGAGNIATGMVPGPGPRRPPSQMMTPARARPTEESRLSPESWEEDEKFGARPQRYTWRDRILGAGAGVAAYEGVKRVFSGRRRRDDEYVDENYRPPLGGNQNMVSQTDVSRVEAGQAPMSPDDPRRRERVNIAGVQPMTPTATPSRRPHMPRPSADSMSYTDEESVMDLGSRPLPQQVRHDEDGHTLRNSIASLGAVAGFREWNRHRRERREQQRLSRMRQQELDAEEYNRQNISTYPRPQDAGGRRPSIGGTVTTATDVHDAGFVGSNPELSRTNYGSGRPDTMHPPLPATAGALAGASMDQQRVHESTQDYQLPPPPPGPPPHGGIRPENLPPPPPGPPPPGRSNDYTAPGPGSLQMPQGAINPDPSRLVSSENVQSTSSNHPSGPALFGAVAGDLAAGRRRPSQSESPSRRGSQSSRNRLQRRERRGSNTSASVSALNTNVPAASDQPTSPPVAVKVKMHNDGRHVTLRRLGEEEAAAERAARRAERRTRRRGDSSVGSGLDDDLPPGSNQRYRRNGNRMERRSSVDQPITNVPPPPAMSSTTGSHRPPSELNLPPGPPTTAGAASAGPLRPPTHSVSPQDGQGLSSPPAGSGMTSPGDAGTGTDVSAFADNRRRRRAERQRRLEAARGGGGGGRVEFE